MVRTCVLYCVFLTTVAMLASEAVPDERVRHWSDGTGKYSVKAKWIETNGENVVLLTENGKQLTIPKSKLSAVDQMVIQASSIRRQVNVPNPPVDEIIEFLTDPDRKNIHEKSRELSKLKDLGRQAEKAIPVLVNIATDEKLDKRIRNDAVVCLHSIGEPAIPGLVTVIADCADSESTTVVHNAFAALTTFGPKAKAAIPAILTFVVQNRDKNRLEAERCIHSIEILASLGANHDPFVPLLCEVIKVPTNDDAGQVDKFWGLRATAALKALGQYGADAKVALPALLTLVQRHDQETYNVACSAADCLGAIGQHAKESLETLRSIRDAPSTPEPLASSLESAILRIRDTKRK